MSSNDKPGPNNSKTPSGNSQHKVPPTGTANDGYSVKLRVTKSSRSPHSAAGTIQPLRAIRPPIVQVLNTDEQKGVDKLPAFSFLQPPLAPVTSSTQTAIAATSPPTTKSPSVPKIVSVPQPVSV